MQENTLPTISRSINLVIAIKANDDAVLSAFYAANYSKTEKYILNNSGTADEAKDIFQESFIALWRNIQMDKFSPENETALEGYLYSIARNKWIDHLRSSHRKRTIPLEEANEMDIGQRVMLSENENIYISDVRKNFVKLGDTCKELLTRFYFNKDSLRDIALHFNWTEATAKNNKYRCMQTLKEYLKK